MESENKPMKHPINKKKLLVIILSSILSTLILSVAIPFTILGIRTASLKHDYSYLKVDPTYSNKVEVPGVELVSQHVSCGYASIEMISSYYGDKVTEDELDARNRSISTSSSRGFLKEINRSIPDKKFVMHAYLKSDVLLKEIYDSLNKDNPVIIEWAAKFEGEWTLHFSVVAGLDLANDNVRVYNPYGYIENITADEFISRTSFKAYSNIPLFLNFGFAFGAFHKNVLFYAE